MDPLSFTGRHAKWVMAAGLVVAALLPGLAQWLSKGLVPLIMLLMFFGALRLRPEETAQILHRPGRSVAQALALQMAMPLAVALVLVLTGQILQLWAMALVLALSAPSIVSSPNIAAILGLDAATAMRLMIWGTALVPLSALPALVLIFGTSGIGPILFAALKLTGVIAVAGGLGLLVRRLALSRPSARTLGQLDGASALALGIFVIALMPALREDLLTRPNVILGWIAFAFVLNFSSQIGVFYLLRRRGATQVSGAIALIAGNRNLALFFAALSPQSAAPLLPFLAAYQFPMFLTPLLLGWLYRRA
jgi:ACR3 family arsenite transporter